MQWDSLPAAQWVWGLPVHLLAFMAMPLAVAAARTVQQADAIGVGAFSAPGSSGSGSSIAVLSPEFAATCRRLRPTLIACLRFVLSVAAVLSSSEFAEEYPSSGLEAEAAGSGGHVAGGSADKSRAAAMVPGAGDSRSRGDSASLTTATAGGASTLRQSSADSSGGGGARGSGGRRPVQSPLDDADDAVHSDSDSVRSLASSDSEGPPGDAGETPQGAAAGGLADRSDVGSVASAAAAAAAAAAMLLHPGSSVVAGGTSSGYTLADHLRHGPEGSTAERQGAGVFTTSVSSGDLRMAAGTGGGGGGGAVGGMAGGSGGPSAGGGAAADASSEAAKAVACAHDDVSIAVLVTGKADPMHHLRPPTGAAAAAAANGGSGGRLPAAALGGGPGSAGGGTPAARLATAADAAAAAPLPEGVQRHRTWRSHHLEAIASAARLAPRMLLDLGVSNGGGGGAGGWQQQPLPSTAVPAVAYGHAAAAASAPPVAGSGWLHPASSAAAGGGLPPPPPPPTPAGREASALSVGLMQQQQGQQQGHFPPLPLEGGGWGHSPRDPLSSSSSSHLRDPRLLFLGAAPPSPAPLLLAAAVGLHEAAGDGGGAISAPSPSSLSVVSWDGHSTWQQQRGGLDAPPHGEGGGRPRLPSTGLDVFINDGLPSDLF